MNNYERRPIAIAYLLIFTLLFSTFAFGQNAGKTEQAKAIPAQIETPAFAAYLMEVQGNNEGSQSYTKEAQSLAKILSSNTAKNAVLIDEYGYSREAVLQSVAARLAAANGKKLFRINWNALFTGSKDQETFDRTLKGIITQVEASKGRSVVYLDDIASFSSETPVLGAKVASDLYRSLSAGKMQIMSAADSASFEHQIAGDAKLRSKFERVEFSEDSGEDSFVGDKLSPDLRELVNSADQNRTVKVILQSDDIDNPQLLSVLKQQGVVIGDRAASLDMMFLDLPVRAAEQVAALQSAKHLSLDREVEFLGHIETTTGVSQVRTMTNTIGIGGLVNTVTSQLDGSGIGIAVVDSGVYEDHRSFRDSVSLLGGERVVKSVDFTGTSSSSFTVKDPYGHGSHVAGLIAGSKGTNTELLEYRGIAPNANVINVRVLGDNGTGTSASLIQGLDWILANRQQYNIKVVNMSLGTPAIETWRNDPLCRAARRLVDAGIVVVAAAGNNGKNEAGQKLYGAIHSPGNDPSVITVGAANTFGTDARDDDGITTYSSRGPTRSYYTNASGQKVYDHLIKPDLVAPGNKVISAIGKNSSILSANPQLRVSPTSSNSDDVTMMYLSGTSMAAPIVSGAAALLLQANPKLTPNMVKMLLEYTAQPLAGFNMFEQGAGELNIEGAVRVASSSVSDKLDAGRHAFAHDEHDP